MADLAGRLNIDLNQRDGRVEARIRSSRLAGASRVFVGKTVAETTSGLPALFSVCATAQACACVSACEAAQGLVPSPGASRLRQLLVDAETVKEHLWRMLLDWPRFLERPPDGKAMRAVLAAHSGLRAALGSGTGLLHRGAEAVAPDLSKATACLAELARVNAEQILGADPVDWLQQVQTVDDLLRWAGDTDSAPASLMREVHGSGCAGVGRNPVTALPGLSASDLAPILGSADVEGFAAAPTWRDAPRESSPFTRRSAQPLIAHLTCEFGNGLLPRLASQLVEVAVLQPDLRRRLTRLDEAADLIAGDMEGGAGIARVQAARGLLVHWVVVERGRIRGYRILAPTEWNFHPLGVVTQGLSALPFTDAVTLKRLARLFVTAVDPCVEYHVTVS